MRAIATATAAVAAALYVGILINSAMAKIVFDLQNLPTGGF